MPRCFGQTKDDKRCRNNVIKGKYCHLHKSQARKRRAQKGGG